ncbi:MAG: polyprenyl synthetase family protein [Acidimicrobiales bacterium]
MDASTSTPHVVPASLRIVSERVAARLAMMLDAELERWSAFAPDLSQPLASLAQLVLGGGKRLRPAFAYWGNVAGGGLPEDPRVTDAGAAFELLQAFALVHDDVMDNSALRRGRRTAHLEFADRHRSDTWRGESRRFGEGVAVLLGDLAHVYADQLTAAFPPDAIDVWNDLRVELMVGQLLDLFGTARGDTDYSSARRIARYKSGKYTIERPLHLGAALAGRLDTLAGPLSAYGDPLGEAFQLRDDVLGVFGDSDLLGKPVGDDLREGKPTPLLALATEAATPAQARLLARVGDPGLDTSAIGDLQELFVATGALAAVETSIRKLTGAAIESIERSSIPAEARAALVELAVFVAERDR